MVRFVGEWTRPPRGILVDDPGGKCGPILVELPTDPTVHPRAHFAVVDDAELKKFLESRYVLIPNAKTHKKGKITARLQGRFDVAPSGKGFGHSQLYSLRLVLQQVSNVSVQESNDSAGWVAQPATPGSACFSVPDENIGVLYPFRKRRMLPFGYEVAGLADPSICSRTQFREAVKLDLSAA